MIVMRNMGYVKLLLNIGLVLAFCVDENSGNSFYEMVDWADCSLDNIVPKHYNVKLIPNMDKNNYTFAGEILVSFTIRSEAQEISMHSQGLTFTEEETLLFNKDNGDRYTPAKHVYQPIKQKLVLTFEKKLPAGNYTMDMRYTGVLSQDQNFYKNEQGEITAAVTQTEEVTARQIFPCWDQPAMKATFSIHVKHPSKYTVLSNMLPKILYVISNQESGSVWTEFLTTPVIPTYLVAIIMYTSADISTFESTYVDVRYRSDLYLPVKFACDIAKNIIEWLTIYTKMVIQKTILVVLPDSLIPKTVISWGLIVHRESDLMYNNDMIDKKRQIASLIAGQVAREWFGNLVTPSCWFYIWLREGFSTFYRSYILSMIRKDWRSMDILVVEDMHTSFYYDIDNMPTVTLTNNIGQDLGSSLRNDDYISYAVSQKASVLLRMLQYVITDDVFQKGIITYLSTHKYSSAAPDDLWKAMQTALDKSDEPHCAYKVKEVMNSWTKQKRFPVITVTRSVTRTGTIIISQKPFGHRNIAITNKWWIPVTYATQSNPDFSNTLRKYWLRPQDEIITLDHIDQNDWIIINLQQIGYYRVNYDKTNWQKIVDYLNSIEYTKIHVLNRAQLIDDAYAFIRYKQIDISIFLNLTKYLSQETDYIAWYSMFKIFTQMSSYLVLPESDTLKLHFSDILDNALNKIGYEEKPDEDDFTKLKRVNMTNWACNFGSSKCRSVATVKLDEHLANPETHKILPHWEAWTYCAGLMAANMTTWNKILDLYFLKRNKTLLESLACIEDSKIITNYLNNQSKEILTLENKEISTILLAIIKKHAHNNVVLNYMLNNYKALNRSLLTMSTSVVLSNLISNVHSVEQLDKISEFLNKLDEPDTVATMKRVLLVRKQNLEFEKFLFSDRFLGSGSSLRKN